MKSNKTVETKGNYEKALAYYRKSLKIWEDLDDKKEMGACHCNLGNAYSEQKKYEDALAHYLKGVDIYNEIGDKKGMAFCYNNIGNIHMKQNNHEK